MVSFAAKVIRPEIARAINDSGAIVGTATYTGTATTAGSHGVLLCPASIKIAKTPSTDTDYVTDSNGGYIPIKGKEEKGTGTIRKRKRGQERGKGDRHN